MNVDGINEEKPVQTEKDAEAIKIIVINDIFYVWEVSEYIKLIRDHRIFGSLDGGVGGSLNKPRGSSLPVRLSGIEAHYLVKHGIANAFRVPALNQRKPEIPHDKVIELKRQRREEQLEKHKSKRKMEIESMVDKIIEGKRRKGRGLLVPDKKTVIQEEIQKVGLPYEMTQIDIVDPWITEEDYVPCDLPLPDNSLMKLRYMVFEDFHLRRKYCLTSGLKFGGDFLAYPGHPTETHAEFIIVCHDSSRCAEPPYINSQIRLATTVKKTLLLALLDNKKNSVKYKVMNPKKSSSKAQD